MQPTQTSADDVDALNARFYSRFPFPWKPQSLQQIVDPGFETRMLSQALGDFASTTVPADGDVWVAGCGTNQAVMTALRFPNARVVGSDLSEASLEIANATARELGLTNLELRRESLGQVTYREQFDLVFCTGVIHHNADPPAVLARLSEAMRPQGVLELMVYNRFHRITTTAFQRAVRLLLGSTDGHMDFDAEFDVARSVVRDGFSTPGLMKAFLRDYKSGEDARIADSLIQPVEWSYTVSSVCEMAEEARLAVVAPCINAFDVARGTWQWEMEFGDAAVQQRYDALPDARRWEISNLLMLEMSPKLWFYLRRRDSGPHPSSRELCDRFAATIFRRTATEERVLTAAAGRGYTASPPRPYPAPPTDATTRRILSSLDPNRPIGETLRGLGLGSSFASMNVLRQRLTTPAFPYLTAASE
jgi:SAM-dependent methyltransferase